MSDGGKGDTQRPESKPGAYSDGWERIFGKDAASAKEGDLNAAQDDLRDQRRDDQH